MKAFVRDKATNIPFVIRDSKVTNVMFEENNVTFELDKISEFDEKGKEHEYKGRIVFHQVDFDKCHVVVFDRCMDDEEFRGNKYKLKDYLDKFKNTQFEILTEGYNGNDKTFIGWIWGDGWMISGIASVWCAGDMVYYVDKE